MEPKDNSGTKPWLQVYDEGVPASIDYPQVPLDRLLAESAAKHPEHPAIIFGAALGSRVMDQSMTYRQLESGAVTNVLQVKITNRTRETRRYDVGLTGDAEVTSSDLPLTLAGGESASVTLHITLPLDRFERGRAGITVRVTDDAGFDREYGQHVLGPLYGGRPAAETGS